MNKTWIILKREYLTRVKKKSFIVTTLLVPLFFAALMVVPVWLSTRDDKQERTIAVYDESSLFLGQLGQEGYTKYHSVDQTRYESLKSNLRQASITVFYTSWERTRPTRSSCFHRVSYRLTCRSRLRGNSARSLNPTRWLR